MGVGVRTPHKFLCTVACRKKFAERPDTLALTLRRYRALAIMSHYLRRFCILSGSRNLGGPEYIGFIRGIHRNVLVSVHIALIAISIQHILEALLVYDCVCRDRDRSCYLLECKIVAMVEYLSVLVRILEMMSSCATGL